MVVVYPVSIRASAGMNARPNAKCARRFLDELVLDAEARIEDAEVALRRREVRLERRVDGLGGDAIEPPAERNDGAAVPQLERVLGVDAGRALVAVRRERRRPVARSRVRTAHARDALVVDADDEAVGARPVPRVLDLQPGPAEVALERQIRQERRSSGLVVVTLNVWLLSSAW